MKFGIYKGIGVNSGNLSQGTKFWKVITQ